MITLKCIRVVTRYKCFESRYMKIFSRTGILNVVNHVAVSTVVVGRESCETIRFL
jgi:hypothetical protein